MQVRHQVLTSANERGNKKNESLLLDAISDSCREAAGVSQQDSVVLLLLLPSMNVGLTVIFHTNQLNYLLNKRKADWLFSGGAFHFLAVSIATVSWDYSAILSQLRKPK